MCRFLIVVLAALLFSHFALAQSSDRFEIFGGYSYINGDFTGVSNEGTQLNLQGWNASAEVKGRQWLGFVADFGGYYPSLGASSAKAHTFLFGPQVSLPLKRITPFAHFLAGATHVAGSQTFLTHQSQSSIAYAIGGGVDFAVTDRFALRAQFDSLHNDFTSQDNQTQPLIDRRVVRISTGIVFRF